MINKPQHHIKEHVNSDELENTVSRRAFLFGVASIFSTTISLPASSIVGLYEPFSFAAVSDIHLATGLPDTYTLLHESQLFLQEAVKIINSEKPDFVIFCGDQVESLGKEQSNWQLFIDVAQGLNAPWSFVLGEHDIFDSLPIDKMQTFGSDWKSHGIETTKPYWSQSPLPGVHIIGLDTSQPNSPEGSVSHKQLEWLQKDLEENKHKFTIVFSHHPLLPPPPYDSGPPWDEFILPQGPQVREILGSFPKVRLAVSGHVHVSHVQQEKDVWYVSCPSLSVYPCAFRIFRITPDSITVKTYSVNFPALVKKAKKMLDDSTLAYKYDATKPQRFSSLIAGEHLDNDVMLPLVPGGNPQPVKKDKMKRQIEHAKKEQPTQRKKTDSKSKKGGKKGNEPQPLPTDSSPNANTIQRQDPENIELHN